MAYVPKTSYNVIYAAIGVTSKHKAIRWQWHKLRRKKFYNILDPGACIKTFYGRNDYVPYWPCVFVQAYLSDWLTYYATEFITIVKFLLLARDD